MTLQKIRRFRKLGLKIGIISFLFFVLSYFVWIRAAAAGIGIGLKDGFVVFVLSASGGALVQVAGYTFGKMPGIGLPIAPIPLMVPVLIGFGMALYFRHQTSRRPNGRCPGCEYDLTGNISGRCPECGLDQVEWIAFLLKEKESAFREKMIALAALGFVFILLGGFPLAALVDIAQDLQNQSGYAMRATWCWLFILLSIVVTLFLMGLRAVRHALRRIRVSHRVSKIDHASAATIMANLSASIRGKDFHELLTINQTIGDLQKLLQYLAFFQWVGVGGNWDHVWLWSEVRPAISKTRVDSNDIAELIGDRDTK